VSGRFLWPMHVVVFSLFFVACLLSVHVVEGERIYIGSVFLVMSSFYGFLLW